MARIIPTLKASPARKKQLMMAGGVGAMIVGVALAAAWFADSGSNKSDQAPVDKPEQVSLNLAVPGQQLNDKDVWRANEASKIEALNKEIAAIKQNMVNSPQSSGGAMQGTAGAGINEVPMPPPAAVIQPGGNLRPLQPMGSAALPPLPPPPPGRPGQFAQPGMDPNAPMQPVVKRAFTLEVSDSTVAAPAAPQAQPQAAGMSSAPSKEEKTSAENYLPAGTFMRVVLLAGLDAPTGGQAQNNPHPILMRVLDPAQLPNRYMADMKDCVVTANGYGDISSERAYIRTDRLSCIDQKGGAVDISLKGYVAGEDGKAGMRGRLVSKQGQALANAFLAGIGSGIGQAFKESSSTVSTSPLGSTSTVTDGKELQAGLASGVGSAMSQLSKYYIKLAEQVFPVIEVDGGRVVDVVLTRGQSIERR
ncbi:MAG: TraB/VirB10 family protein [Gammaproteobacteria bacterium]|nr:TraB/VirB10 family protein [Gammaproteobacteria bacterium]MBU1409735.1 TraB/VirB10 family protein [Gammaproteobacteria bacterium]